ncbi:MAG TPA: aspartyl protease family protein [Vicinamibacterales bacterium]|nr:aspartyl protease family protein [Vicinamibacterales bacterium]
MQRVFRGVAVAAMVAAASLAVSARQQPQSQSGDIELQVDNQFFNDGRYVDALDAYEKSLAASTPADGRAAHTGAAMSALRAAEFASARKHGEALFQMAPQDPDALALYADTLWSNGLFEEAETRYQQALVASPDLPRGHHGMARALAARSKLDEALAEAELASRLAPRDLEVHHTIGTIYERMHKYEEASTAFNNYVNLLPNKDRSEQAAWARAEVKFLSSFGQRVPFEMDPGADEETYVVDFKLVNEKIVVRAKVNEGSFQDFVVDTGAENTVITRGTAQRLGITPITYTLSAGVGEVGLRGLQLARINQLELGSLKLRNVPCLVKDPPLRDLPTRESESLSPLALGFSMVIDYKTQKITFGKHLPEEAADFELPLRLHRLATVRGNIDGSHAADFVVDTGGEVISISQATATSLGRPEPTRKIKLQVYGSSGWDRDAFLMPGVNLNFDKLLFPNYSVVVLNLDTPSALLGFQLGGIVGHKFLSKYRVGIDLERSLLRLKASS